ncbi:MAG: hypothetical protein A3D89_04235 [Planctomycetes bacterium RIFCSPHIGHO2_02_FULL_52_58]|nr:MAG: hypothetical protein A3D89_04235 [Planctomycetes bacterium RIFCSPHIGHO2_02_FULL_52_58]
MNWRNQATHREETKVVKTALRSAGLPVARVGHGTGTAWGWLDIELARSPQAHIVITPDKERMERVAAQARYGNDYFMPCINDCLACTTEREARQKAILIAQEVTGRSGEYDGEITVSHVSGS